MPKQAFYGPEIPIFQLKEVVFGFAKYLLQLTQVSLTSSSEVVLRYIFHEKDGEFISEALRASFVDLKDN